MKTKSTLVATLVAISFLIGNLCFAGNSKFRNSQSNTTPTMSFYRTDTILVILPETFKLTEMDKKDIESYVFWEKNQNKPIYNYKLESEVSKTDSKKHLIFYGSLSDFQRKDFLGIPIKKLTKGFRFNNQVFDQPNDAFFYLNERSTRMYICKNSNQAQHEFFSVGIGAYPLHIFRGDTIVITGAYLDND